MDELQIGQIRVPYDISWSNKRESIGFFIDQSLELEVKAPTSASLKDVEESIESKKEWILDKINTIGQQKDKPLEKEFLSGEKLLFNGRRYKLKVETNKSIKNPVLKFKKGKFELKMPEYEKSSEHRNKAKEAVKEWYRKRAKEKFPSVAERYANQMNVSSLEFDVTDMRKKWGVFEEEKIKINWKLILAPTRIQNYIIAHELAHSKEKEHSQRFWNIIGTLMPDYKDRREWLRINGSLIDF